MDSRQQAILKTLLYADLFDYPLKKTEIYKYLITREKFRKEDLFAVLNNNNLPVENTDGFFYITGRKGLVAIRKKRETVSVRKLQLAKKIIKKISFIPTVKLIGISGSLSMGNSNENDDIDLFVITDKNLAWITRLLLVVLLTFLGVYRNRQSKNHSNKICLNMILDENHMHFDKKTRNLYTAHEIIQLLPVFNKEKTYEKFIQENSWIKHHLPNFEADNKSVSHKIVFFDKLITKLLRFSRLEKIAKLLQLRYMSSHRTSEITLDGFLKFHPHDHKKQILKDYEKELKKRNVGNVIL